MKAFVLPRPSLGWVVRIEMSDPRGAKSKEKSISHSLFSKGLESGCLRQFALSSPFHSDHYLFCPAFFSPNSHTETTKKGSWKVEEMQKMTVFVCCTDTLSCNYDQQSYKEAQVFCLKPPLSPVWCSQQGVCHFRFLLFLMYFAVIVFTITWMTPTLYQLLWHKAMSNNPLTLWKCHELTG